MGGFVNATANAGRKEYEHGPYLFAFAFYNVVGNTVEQRNRTLHRRFEAFFKNINFCGNGFLDLVNAQHRAMSQALVLKAAALWQSVTNIS